MGTAVQQGVDGMERNKPDAGEADQTEQGNRSREKKTLIPQAVDGGQQQTPTNNEHDSNRCSLEIPAGVVPAVGAGLEATCVADNL